MGADQTFHMNLTADNTHWGLGVSSYNVNNIIVSIQVCIKKPD